MSLESQIDNLQRRVRVASDVGLAALTKVSFESDLPAEHILGRLGELPIRGALFNEGKPRLLDNFEMFGKNVGILNESIVMRSAVVVPAMGRGFSLGINIVCIGDVYSSIQRLQLYTGARSGLGVVSTINTPAVYKVPTRYRQLEFTPFTTLEDKDAFNILAVAEDMYERRVRRIHPPADSL